MAKKTTDGKRRNRNKFKLNHVLPDYGVEEWRDGAVGAAGGKCINQF